MAASFVTALGLQTFGHFSASDATGGSYAAVMLITVGVTTAAWLVATFVTRPESNATLDRFYRQGRPGGPGGRGGPPPVGVRPGNHPRRPASVGERGARWGGGLR